jgi:hypothetical protein
MARSQTLERKLAGGRVQLPQHFQFAGNGRASQQVNENLFGFRPCIGE